MTLLHELALFALTMAAIWLALKLGERVYVATRRAFYRRRTRRELRRMFNSTDWP